VRTSNSLALGKDLALLGLHAVAIVLGFAIGWYRRRSLAEDEASGSQALTIALFSVLGTMLSIAVWIEPWAYARTLLPLWPLSSSMPSPLRG